MKRRTFLASTAASAGVLSLGACGGGTEAHAASAETATATLPAVSSSHDPATATSQRVSEAPRSPGEPRSGQVPAWVASLPLWHWYEIPGTALASVDPTPRPLGSTGPRSKIDAWCGAGLKREGSVYLIGAAGGHADYAGNEVDALALNVESPKWVQLRAPTPNDQIIDRSPFYADMRAAATHTYWNTQFIDSMNRLMIFTRNGVSGLGAPAPEGWPYANSRNHTRSFSMDANDWDPPLFVSVFPGEGGAVAALCVKHPVSEDVYLSRLRAGWWRWMKAANSWERLSGTSKSYAGSAIDPNRDRMLLVGGWSKVAPEMRRLDGSSVQATFRGLGAAAITDVGNTYPGVIYDEALDQFLVLRSIDGVVRLHTVDAETTEVLAPGLTGTPPRARTNGIHNSVQYVPELKGFVIATSHSGSVYFVRTAA